MNIKTGVVEETAGMLCEIDFFAIPVNDFGHYETEIRVDRRDIPYHKVLKDVKNGGTYAEAIVRQIFPILQGYR